MSGARRSMRPGSPGRETGEDAFIAVLCALAVTAPILLYGTPDEETYEFSIFSILYFFKKLVAGGQPFYAADFAFGAKMPNGQWFLRFPASLAAVFGSARILYSATWLLGQLVFAFFLLRLLRAVSVTRRVRVAALATAALSFSNLAYFYVDDWPEVFVGWCLVPFCLWSTVTLVEACRVGGNRIGRMALCALAFGLLVGNGHPLHSFIWFCVLMLFFVPLLWSTPSLFPVLAAVGAIAAFGALDMAAQTLGGLGSSHGTFNPMQDATRYASLTAADYLEFLQPALATVQRGWAGVLASPYGRRPFYGAVFFVCAVAGALLALIRPQLFPGVGNRGVVRALGFAFLGTIVLTVAPSWAVFNLIGQGWHFKDGQTIFAVVLAALVLDGLHRRGWRRLTIALLALQIAQVALVATPILRGALRNQRHLLFARDVRHDAFWTRPPIAALRGRSRVVVAGALDLELFGNQRAADGVVAVTDFVLEDIGIVNGWYRGTVTPGFMASNDPRYGAYQTVLRWDSNLRHLDRAALDALGITHLLVFADEALGLQQALGLEEAGTVPVSGPRSPVAVLRNPRAWDRAVLIAAAGPRDLAARAGCAEPFIWCADFAPLAANHVPGTRMHRDGDAFVVELPSGHPAGYVLLTQVLGDGWTARVDGQARPVRPFHDAFVAVDVRDSDRVVELRYDSRTQAALLGAGVVQMTLCVAIAVFSFRRRNGAGAG